MTARTPRLVGIYGGTFNPVHIAHLILAEEIRDRLGLETVLFVPSNLPPHKGEGIPSGTERLAMVRLAIRGNPSFGAIDLEVRRAGKSYTVETLHDLSRRLPAGTEPVFLIGMDAFEEIGTWHEAGRLAAVAHFALFPRVGHPLADPRLWAPASWGLASPRRLPGGGQAWRTATGNRVYLVPTEQLSLSASAIRARVARGASIRYLVPAAVEREIARRGLYRSACASPTKRRKLLPGDAASPGNHNGTRTRATTVCNPPAGDAHGVEKRQSGVTTVRGAAPRHREGV